jgi:signal transduction histidine kinase
MPTDEAEATGAGRARRWEPVADVRRARRWDVARGGRARRWDAVARARAVLDALEHLVGGLGTAILALVALVCLVATALACLIGVGLLLLPAALHAVRAVADRERARLSRWGPEIISPPPAPFRLRAAVADRTVRRELRWLVSHATLGFAIGLIGLVLPLNAVRDGTFPLWWRLVPPDAATPSLGLWTVPDQLGAFGVGLLGLAWIAALLGLAPGMARLQAWPGRRLLAPPADTDLSLRITQLTATRAAALDAHATELRRIERSLHDGTQNRLVAVNVLLGAARRALARNPADAEAILERAQHAAEQALAELRTVARGILPPVLTDRGLAGALAGLTATCGVPCRVDVDVPGRCAASVEATAYFVVAEALTNISRHSQARHATVTVRRQGDRLHLRIDDDGRGGADERHGSGITGIRRRIEAHDGRLTLTSPPGGPTTFQVELPCGS